MEIRRLLEGYQKFIRRLSMEGDLKLRLQSLQQFPYLQQVQSRGLDSFFRSSALSANILSRCSSCNQYLLKNHLHPFIMMRHSYFQVLKGKTKILPKFQNFILLKFSFIKLKQYKRSFLVLLFAYISLRFKICHSIRKTNVKNK